MIKFPGEFHRSGNNPFLLNSEQLKWLKDVIKIYTQVEIAKEMGVSVEMVRRFQSRYNLGRKVYLKRLKRHQKVVDFLANSKPEQIKKKAIARDTPLCVGKSCWLYSRVCSIRHRRRITPKKCDAIF